LNPAVETLASGGGIAEGCRVSVGENAGEDGLFEVVDQPAEERVGGVFGFAGHREQRGALLVCNGNQVREVFAGADLILNEKLSHFSWFF
jgi:hypothetical protein